MTELTELTIKETARLLRLRSFSAAELLTAHAEQIERLDHRVKAYLRLTPELWEKQADEADRRQVLARIEGERRIEQLGDGEVDVDHHAHRVIVARLGHDVGGDIAAGAGLVVDHDGLAQP